MTQYTEYGKIRPIIAGELTCTDRFGQDITPRLIRFDKTGAASAVLYHYLYGTHLAPVRKRGGEMLVYEGFAGLECEYNAATGTLENFREED